MSPIPPPSKAGWLLEIRRPPGSVATFPSFIYKTRRRSSIARIRVALAATRREVTALVVWPGTSMAIVGSAVGLVLAPAAACVMSNLVYDVSRDVASTCGATAVLPFVAAVASFLLARRTATVAPGVTLRAE